MDSTQKAVKNQEICEPLQGNLGITQSSGLDKLSGYPDNRSFADMVIKGAGQELAQPPKCEYEKTVTHRRTGHG